MLRKFVAILLLAVYVFTAGGYRLVVNFFEQRADKSLMQKLDKQQYNDAELITLRVPLNLPYTIDKSEFERCDGTIKINGIFYNYVTRKIIDDTLVLQCIPNNEKNKLSAVKDEYAKNIDNTQSSSANEKASGSILKLFFFGYNYNLSYNVNSFSFASFHNYILKKDYMVSSPFIELLAKPPEVLSI